MADNVIALFAVAAVLIATGVFFEAPQAFSYTLYAIAVLCIGVAIKEIRNDPE